MMVEARSIANTEQDVPCLPRTRTPRTRIQRFASLAMSVGLCAGVSTTGHAQPGIDGVIEGGSAQLSLTDLRTMLRQSEQNSNDMLAEFRLGERERTVVLNEITRVEREQFQIQQSGAKDLAQQREQLMKERKEIQLQRMSANSDQDRALAQKLFQNIVKESNLKARTERAVQNHETQNLVTVSYIYHNGQKIVDSIRVGKKVAWAGLRHRLIAQQ